MKVQRNVVALMSLAMTAPATAPISKLGLNLNARGQMTLPSR